MGALRAARRRRRTALGITAPEELRPVMLVLILGVVTDYVVFMLSGVRRRIGDGVEPGRAATATLAQVGPIITVAGLIVSLGIATLMVGTLDFFRAFGPGLAIAVAVTLLAGLTFVPAVLAILGRASSRRAWPSPCSWPTTPRASC